MLDAVLIWPYPNQRILRSFRPSMSGRIGSQQFTLTHTWNWNKVLTPFPMPDWSHRTTGFLLAPTPRSVHRILGSCYRKSCHRGCPHDDGCSDSQAEGFPCFNLFLRHLHLPPGSMGIIPP